MKADFYVAANPANVFELWDGSAWNDDANLSKAYRYHEGSIQGSSKHPDNAKRVFPEIVGAYPTGEEIKSRVEALCQRVFGEKFTEIELDDQDPYFDPSVTIGGCITIYWSDETRILTGLSELSLVPGYQVATVNYNPGVFRYRDGSGEPPSVDLNDIGTPHNTIELAVREAVKLIAESRLADYLDYEADMAMDDES